MLNNIMFPANVTNVDNIGISKPVYDPVPVIVKKPPSLLRQQADTPPSSVKDRKLTSAKDFPKMRGFGLD